MRTTKVERVTLRGDRREIGDGVYDETYAVYFFVRDENAKAEIRNRNVDKYPDFRRVILSEPGVGHLFWGDEKSNLKI